MMEGGKEGGREKGKGNGRIGKRMYNEEREEKGCRVSVRGGRGNE